MSPARPPVGAHSLAEGPGRRHEGAPVSERKFSVLNDDWEVLGENTFVSPLNPKEGNQMMVFADFVKNGWISADITPLDGSPRREGGKSTEASLVFRYAGQDALYYAGLSAFNTRFFVAKVIQGPLYLNRGWVGSSTSVRHDKTYRLRVEFNGSQIKLYENGVQQLIVYDEQFQRGQLGLAAWKCRARFDNVQYGTAQPVAFVVMPFSSELKFVYGVIKSMAEAYGMRCERADESFISRPVMDEVKKKIAEADLVFVDFTGRNPNVYYEAGLAEAWKKDWIVMAQASEDMTFDVRHIGSIRYSNTMGADERLREDLKQAIEALGYRLPVPPSAPAVQPAPVAPERVGAPADADHPPAQTRGNDAQRQRRRQAEATPAGAKPTPSGRRSSGKRRGT
jgi:hypothetical protein